MAGLHLCSLFIIFLLCKFTDGSTFTSATSTHKSSNSLLNDTLMSQSIVIPSPTNQTLMNPEGVPYQKWQTYKYTPILSAVYSSPYNSRQKNRSLNAQDQFQTLRSPMYPQCGYMLLTSWTIQTETGKLIQLCFDDFNIYPELDRVGICEGAVDCTIGNPGSMCQIFNGSDSILHVNVQVSLSNNITFCYLTVGNPNFRGFSVRYRSLNRSSVSINVSSCHSSSTIVLNQHVTKQSYNNNLSSHSSSVSTYSNVASYYPGGAPYPAYSNPNISVRLATNAPTAVYSSYYSYIPPLFPVGLVQVYTTSWSYICGSNWTASNAAVVCRTFGYQSNNSIAFTINHHPVVYFTMTVYSCTGDETNLTNCPISSTSGQFCNTLAGAICNGS